MLLTNKSLALAPFLIGLLLGFSIRIAHGQENIQHQIPPSLVECYNTTFFQNRDNRLPSNLETFITLIEKVENAPNYQYDIRQLSVALLHRFRQDGIELAAGVPQYPGVIPYAPTGFQFPKFRILLSRLIPGNAFNFPNNSLSREERCSMHFMLSSSFDLRVRGNENQVCNQLSTFRSQRPRRSLDGRNNFMGDVEILEEFKQRSEQKHSSVRMANGKALNDWTWLNMGQQSINTQISQCPVENGVLRTPWGTVAIGNVIAGIAAGLQQQTVQLKTLLALSSRPGTYNAQQVATFNVDNRFAATLAGDLAETTLIQVPTSNTGNASVGATGGWNSTVMPKWYFLTQNTNLEMTDAEIRGDIDGLILALNVASWYGQNPSMKLSQLLRMYYSTNGVLNSGIMACQRQSNFQSMINQNALISQTAGFAQVLDREMTLRVTLTPTIIAQFAAVSTQALANYVPNYMNAVSCPATTQLNSVANSTTVMTNIYVYLDTSWQYTQIVDYVNYVLERLNINPYASSVTMLSANNCTIMVNYTNYISDVYRQWNITTHSLYTPGFSLPSILQSIGNLTQTYMNGQQANNSAGGRSLVALLIPNNAGVSASDSNYAIPQVKYLSEQVPDLRFTYFGGGSIQRFTQYVKNATTDLYPLTFGSSYSTAAEPVVAHIKSSQMDLAPSISYPNYQPGQPYPPYQPYSPGIPQYQPSPPFQSVQPSTLSVSCANQRNITNETIIHTDIFIYMDTSWTYTFISEYINFILQRLNINPYSSSVTLICAQNGAIMVNTTHYITSVYEQWNITTHNQYPWGFSLPIIYGSIGELAEMVLRRNVESMSLGGRSIVALLVPSFQAYVPERDYVYCKDYLNDLNITLPDLNFIIYSGGAAIRWSEFVSNPHTDLFAVDWGDIISDSASPVVERLKNIPRRIFNPGCYYPATTSLQMLQTQYVGGINYYRMLPQYFFTTDTPSYLKITATSPISFTVCTSRMPMPHDQRPKTGCQSITLAPMIINLKSLCPYSYLSADCTALYISVHSQDFAEPDQVTCNYPSCQTTYMPQYTIELDNSCNACSKTVGLGWLLILVLSALIFVDKRSFRID